MQTLNVKSKPQPFLTARGEDDPYKLRGIQDTKDNVDEEDQDSEGEKDKASGDKKKRKKRRKNKKKN